MIRPKKWAYCLEVASVVAKRSTCPRLAVGAVIVTPTYHIVSTGYNGAPKGAPHCTDLTCMVDEADHCVRAVHAEANAIVQAACNGVRTQDCLLFCTHLPCRRCMHLIINAGIKTVVYATAYKSSEDYQQLGVFCNIALHHWEQE